VVVVEIMVMVLLLLLVVVVVVVGVVEVKQSLCRPLTGPETSRRLCLPDFEAIGT
jgi:hypothetical protein